MGTTKVLLVIDGDSSDPVTHSAVVSGELVDAVREVQAMCGLTDADVEEVVQNLEHGRAYWVGENYCFDLIYL